MKIDLNDKIRFEIETMVERYEEGFLADSSTSDYFNYVKAMEVLKEIKECIDNQHIIDEQAIEDLANSIC